ncbi:hypothetical protein KFU94_25275 [Chloroflexi bacterium TSY]|nr:hypothetical protein [Chloroflexi bacterium TSY]
MRLNLSVVILTLFTILMLGACGDALPEVPNIPIPDVPLPELPGIPPALKEIPELIDELGLPDLSQFTDLPELEDLPLLSTPSGAIAFRGPSERRIDIGQHIPGTDMELVAVQNGEAEFRIAGQRSIRSMGDSLDFDGDWAEINGVSYNLRLRIYRVSESGVRAAGVHQLIVHDVQPARGEINASAKTMSFPFTASSNAGDTLAGMTYGYVGENERGAEIAGLPSGDYPYHKMGDSLRWRGFLRPDIPIDYNVRILFYGTNSLRVGGVVHVALPGL